MARNREVVVLSCDRFRCDQVMGHGLQWEKNILHVQSRVCSAPESISRPMYIRPEMVEDSLKLVKQRRILIIFLPRTIKEIL